MRLGLGKARFVMHFPSTLIEQGIEAVQSTAAGFRQFLYRQAAARPNRVLLFVYGNNPEVRMEAGRRRLPVSTAQTYNRPPSEIRGVPLSLLGVK